MKLEYVQGQLDALRWMAGLLADAQQQLQNELIKMVTNSVGVDETMNVEHTEPGITNAD